MKKISSVTLVVLLVCVSVSAVKAYTNEEQNFSIDPPSEWTIDDINTAATVIFYGPIDEDFRINVNIYIESVPPNMTVEQYISANKDQLVTGLDNYELISESTRVINKVDAYEMVSSFTYENVPIKNKQVMLVNGNTAYIITYTAQPTTYQKYLSPVESSIETFKFIESTPTEPEPTETAEAPLISTEVAIIAAVAVAAVIGIVAFLALKKRK